jgi:hypothetical protein
MSETDVTIVLRSAGERTKDLAYRLLCSDASEDQVHLIEEVPFSRAVQRTLEIGVDEGRKWTAAVDADILVRRGALADLVELAEQAPDTLFELEGRIWDKLFGGAREGGIHLYRTNLIPEALTYLDVEAAVHRPEFTVISAMTAKGYTQEKHELVVGLHDFEQRNLDYFRKGVSHARKHQELAWFMEPMWERLAPSDAVIRECLAGWRYGTDNPGLAVTDIRQIGELARIRQEGQPEPEIQSNTPMLNSLDDVSQFMASLKPEPEFNAWERLKAQHERENANREQAVRTPPRNNKRAKWLVVANFLARLFPKRIRNGIVAAFTI